MSEGEEPTEEQLQRCEWISSGGMRCELTKWAHIKYEMNHLTPEPFWALVRAEFIKTREVNQK